MSDAPLRESPQRRAKCCCPSWTGRRECALIRYDGPGNVALRDDEECECRCHEESEDDYYDEDA